MTTASTAKNHNNMNKNKMTKKRRMVLRSSLESLFSRPVQANDDNNDDDDEVEHSNSNSKTKEAAPATPLQHVETTAASSLTVAATLAASTSTATTASSGTDANTTAKTRRRTPGTPSSLILNWNSDLKFKQSKSNSKSESRRKNNVGKSTGRLDGNDIAENVTIGNGHCVRGSRSKREGGLPLPTPTLTAADVMMQNSHDGGNANHQQQQQKAQSPGRGTQWKDMSLSPLPFRGELASSQSTTVTTATDRSTMRAIAATMPSAETATAEMAAAETATAEPSEAETANEMWTKFSEQWKHSTPSPSKWNENGMGKENRNDGDNRIPTRRSEKQRGKRGEESGHGEERISNTVCKTGSKGTDVVTSKHPLNDKNMNVDSLPPHGHGDDPSSSVVSDSSSSDADDHDHGGDAGRNQGHAQRNKRYVSSEEPNDWQQLQRESHEHQHHQQQTQQQLQQHRLEIEYGRLAFLKHQIEQRMQQQKQNADVWNWGQTHFPYSYFSGVALGGTERSETAFCAASTFTNSGSFFGSHTNASGISASAYETGATKNTAAVTPGGKTEAVTPAPTTHSRATAMALASVTPTPGMASRGNRLAESVPNTFATTTTVTPAITPIPPSVPAHHHHAVKTNAIAANDTSLTNTNSCNSMSNHYQITPEQLPLLLSNTTADATPPTPDVSELDIQCGKLAYQHRMLEQRLAKLNELRNNEMHRNDVSEMREHADGNQDYSLKETLEIPNYRKELERALKMANNSPRGDLDEDDFIDRRGDWMGRERVLQRGHYPDDDDESDYYEYNDDDDDDDDGHVDSRKKYIKFARKDGRHSQYYQGEKEDEDDDNDDAMSFKNHHDQRPRSRYYHHDTPRRSKIPSNHSNLHHSKSKKKKKRKRRRVETITRVIHEESSEEEGNSYNSPEKKTRRSYDYGVVPQRKSIDKSKGKRPYGFQRGELSDTDQEYDQDRPPRSMSRRSGVVPSDRRAWNGRDKEETYDDDEDEEESYVKDMEMPRNTIRSKRHSSHRKDLDIFHNSHIKGPSSKYERNPHSTTPKSLSRKDRHLSDRSNNHHRKKKQYSMKITDDNNHQRKNDGNKSNIGLDSANENQQRSAALPRNDKLELDTKQSKGRARSNVSHLSILASLG